MTVSGPGAYNNAVSLATDNPDDTDTTVGGMVVIPLGENEDIGDDFVVADPAISKVGAPQFAQPGEEVVITITTRVRLDAEVPFIVTNTAHFAGDNFDEITSNADIISVWKLPATGELPVDQIVAWRVVLTLVVLFLAGAVAFKSVSGGG